MRRDNPKRIDLKKAQAARVSTIRDINRQIVLNYVREREPISRAEIAREADLQRSTVSTIVEVLKADGLIEEVGTGESTGGRRPTLLRLRAAGAMTVGVDVTPSRTTVALSDLAGRVLARRGFPTHHHPERMIERIIACVKELLALHRQGAVEGIGVSVPGLVDPLAGKVLYIPFFQWRDWPVAERMTAATGLPVRVENDANAAAMAELWFGRPEVRESRDFIMVLVAEGIGTGIVFDGQIYCGERGAAGEFGHMVIGQRGPVACSCGNYDCWESFASNEAALARYRKMSGRAPDDISLNYAQLIERARGGESAAAQAIAETAHFLGIGIANLIVGLSPEAVVVGGLIARVWPLVAEALTEPIERTIRRGLPSARIVPSTLGNQPTLMGAISLVLARKFASVSAA